MTMNINGGALARSAALYAGVGAVIDVGINAISTKSKAPAPKPAAVAENAAFSAAIWAGIGAAFAAKGNRGAAAIVGAVQGAALSLGMNALGQGASHSFGI